MFQRNQGRGKRLVLDIGTSAIRLCELAQTKAGYQLTKYHQQEYNSDPALSEEERRAARLQALQTLLKESKVSTKKVVFGVPGQSVFTRTRTLPPVPEYKVAQIVRYEIQQQIPFSLDQIALDYQVLERTDTGGYEVMMAAIKTDVVDKHIEVLKAAKRSVASVDVCPLASYNWLKRAGEFGDGGDCVALIDIGATTTDIVVEREGKFRFTRPLNVGGNDITRAVGDAFSLDFKDAEKLKRERAFAPTGDAARDGRGGQVVGEVLQRMTSEIMRSFAYFRSLPGGGAVNRVVLCGGGACLRNIIPYLQRQLGIEVRIAQPTSGLALAAGAQQISEAPEQSCVALGLALRTRETVSLEIDLIPPRLVEAARRKEQALYWVLSFTALALISATTIPEYANKNKEVMADADKLINAIGKYDRSLVPRLQPGMPIPTSPAEEELQKAKQVVGLAEDQIKVLDDVFSKRTFWLNEMSFLNDLRPANASMAFSLIRTDEVPPEKKTASAAPGVPMMTSSPAPDEEDEDEDRRGGRGGRGDRDGGGRGGGLFGGGGGLLGGGAGLLGGGGLRPMGAGRGGGAFGVAADDVQMPPPFPSIGDGSAGSALATSTRFSMGGGDDEDDEEGNFGGFAAGRTSAGGAAGASGAVPQQSGLAIYGFAESDAVISEYVEKLKKSEPQETPSGRLIKVERVLFNTSSVVKLPYATLGNAPVQPYIGAGVSSSAYGEGVRDNSVYSFLIRVRFKTYFEGQEEEAQNSGAVVGATLNADVDGEETS
jgi:type IV pilus assembly protein PilM